MVDDARIDGGARSLDKSSNRLRAPVIAAAPRCLGALELADARLRSMDEGDGPVMDSPTSGDPSRDWYACRPECAPISCPNGAVGGAVDLGGRGRVTDEAELPPEAAPVPRTIMCRPSAAWP